MWQIAGKTWIGPIHTTNEDRVVILDKIISEGDYEFKSPHETLIATVFDGVGGESCGGEAADIAARVISDSHCEISEKQEIVSILSLCNAKILEKQQSNPYCSKMATTIAGVLVQPSRYFVFNIGDSRVYRFRNNTIMLLSKDHTLVNSLVKAGMITLEEARIHPKRNVIQRFLGHPTDSVADISQWNDRLDFKELLVICSDGISDVLSYDDWEECLMPVHEETSLLGCIKRIFDRAKTFGVTDNASLIIIRRDNT